MVKQINKGAFAIVFEAEHIQSKKRVVLKIVTFQ
jgi:serine/threonine protein kinase